MRKLALKLKRTYSDGWNDDVGVRLWTWMATIAGSVFLAMGVSHLVIYYELGTSLTFSPIYPQSTMIPPWLCASIGVIVLLVALIGIARQKELLKRV